MMVRGKRALRIKAFLVALIITIAPIFSSTAIFAVDKEPDVMPKVIDVNQVYESKGGGRIKATVTFNKPVKYPFDSLEWRKISDTEFFTYYFRTKDYTLNFEDYDGNPGKFTLKIDQTAPQVVELRQDYEEKEGGRIKATVVFSEPVKYPFSNTNWRKVSDTEFFTYFYRTRTHTISFEDLIGNPNTADLDIVLEQEPDLELTVIKVGSNTIDPSQNTIYNFNAFSVTLNKDVEIVRGSSGISKQIQISYEYSMDNENWIKDNFSKYTWLYTNMLIQEGGAPHPYGTITAGSQINHSESSVKTRVPAIYAAIQATEGTTDIVYVRTIITVIQPDYTESFTLPEVRYSDGGNTVFPRGL